MGSWSGSWSDSAWNPSESRSGAEQPDEVLARGVGNAGAVVRIGGHVLRPTSTHSPAIHALLRHLASVEFDGAPRVVGIDPDGRERLVYIPGDVPIPPFPEWSTTVEALTSTARLLRRFHDATAGFGDVATSDAAADYCAAASTDTADLHATNATSAPHTPAASSTATAADHCAGNSLTTADPHAISDPHTCDAHASKDLAISETAATPRTARDSGPTSARPHWTWSDEMADPSPGEEPVLCHNDVCPENVVFRNGSAIALLDFEFAAPGRRVWDVACFARMCVPIDTDLDAARQGRGGLDPVARLRSVADAYGLLADDRVELVDILSQQFANGGEFVKRRMAAGEEAFIAMWEASGGQERIDRRAAWFADEKFRFLDTLLA